MLLLEARNLKKYYQERKIIDIQHFTLYSGDRIGIVGLNGAGKTTLVNLLSGSLTPDSGSVRCIGKISKINQLDDAEEVQLAGKTASLFQAKTEWSSTLSGGEKTRFKLASRFDQDSNILIADEPTSNLDIGGIELLEQRINNYTGAILLISHDRELLDRTCTKICEISGGSIRLYNGNYSAYRTQKEEELENAFSKYDTYISERQRLERLVESLQHQSRHMKITPKRMGNSEARLHKLGNQKAEKSMDQSFKRIRSRINQLEVVEKPILKSSIKIDVLSTDELHKKILISCSGLTKRFGQKHLFNAADFTIYNNTKTALIGPNGCGKTTLLRMLMEVFCTKEQTNSVFETADKLKIGYFSQELEILDPNRSALENVLESSIYNETTARTILSRLLFSREDIHRKVSVLSGGEKVKVCFAKIFLQDINMLIMDEPTNYLDVFSLEAVEQAFMEYDRTILFVSHDRHFISSVADQILSIENGKLVTFTGTYEQFCAQQRKRNSNCSCIDLQDQILVQQNRLSELIGRLSMLSKNDNKEQLEAEYQQTLTELNRLKVLLRESS